MTIISALVSFLSRFIFEMPDWTLGNHGPALRATIQDRCRDNCQ
ncbi:MAG: hypothetical protein ACO3JL_01790 [Myxococcota bacterium]